MSSINFLNYFQLVDAPVGKNLDNPNNIYFFRSVLQQKYILRKIYEKFYADILDKLKDFPKNELFIEIGSGASFLKEIASFFTTSDLMPYKGVDKVFSAMNIPLSDNSVTAFAMVNVFHHVKDSEQCLSEMNRCLKDGGKIILVEPANTFFSSFIYKFLHHEDFDTTIKSWKITSGGPLSGANMALPWVVFKRDRKLFESKFPNLKITSIKIHTPFSYIISGGFSMKQLIPSWFYPLLKVVEQIISPLNFFFGMFMTVELTKK